MAGTLPLGNLFNNERQQETRTEDYSRELCKASRFLERVRVHVSSVSEESPRDAARRAKETRISHSSIFSCTKQLATWLRLASQEILTQIYHEQSSWSSWALCCFSLWEACVPTQKQQLSPTQFFVSVYSGRITKEKHSVMNNVLTVLLFPSFLISFKFQCL